MKPIEAIKKENENKVYTNLFLGVDIQKTYINKFNVGDLIKIDKIKSVLDKGYLPNYTTEVFQIAVVKHKTPITWELLDKTGELIIGVFLQKRILKSYSIKTFIL
jgi:hypothetical protein